MVTNSHADETPTRRERRKQETRQRLLESAFQLFCERDFETTTIEDITDAADVAKGTFFNYFESKEAILPALGAWRFEVIRHALHPQLGAPASPVARIKAMLKLLAEDPLTRHPLAHRFMTASAACSHPVRPGRELHALLIEQVRLAQAAGEIRGDIDASYLGGMLVATFFQHLLMATRAWPNGTPPISLDSAVDLLLDGAGGPSWRQCP